ncbi:membrane protein [Streptomyces melanogenes]|nr:membrane protein [Streptomyces melanogenes]
MGKRAARSGDRRGRGHTRPRGRGRRSARRHPRALLLVGGLLGLALICGSALAEWRGRDGYTPEPGYAAESPLGSRTPLPTAPPPKQSKKDEKPGEGSDSGKKGDGGDDVPAAGPGTFTPARASGVPVGTGGPLRRYKVLVEDGVDVSPRQAATEVQAILAHPRSWAAHGRGRFQLVSGDDSADVTIKIATPATTDRLCAVNGDTHGELNCEVAGGVVVNLKRWVKGSPQYDGPPAEYRHLIINHEIGHMIGFHQHMDCPGEGKAAPVMMQQIKGLKGCKSNAWPYAKGGAFVDGPAVP